METRPYFLIGDVLACTVSGAAGAWLTWIVLPVDWIAPAGMAGGMVVGMAAGMIIGMLAGVVGGVLFTPLFGAMEISMPAGLSGMVAGMAAGMAAAHYGIGGTAPPGATVVLGIGAAAGLLTLAYCYARHAMLRGVVE